MKLFNARQLAVAAGTVLVTGAAAAAPAMAKTLYVSPKGSDKAACTAKRPCRTIGAAIGKAKAGSTVRVAKGTYKESVTIGRKIKLVGVNKPVINAKGFGNGILVTGAKAAGTVVEGFKVENASEEGILAMQTTKVTIADNVVKYNDKGLKAAKPTGECAAQGPVPGDCGEGLHLMSVSFSKVTGNTVSDNLGGILVTDELGPTHDNLISSNTVDNNVGDCGITVASHNTTGYVGGVLEPTKGGDYRNVIINNTADGNGLKGQGGGILLAAGAPGSAVYGNTVQDNTADGNGLGGFTLHSHAPGQYFDNNKIIDNTFSHDGLVGGPNDTPGDIDVGPGVLTKTVGIIVYSAFTPLKGTVISGNHISNDYYGIWTQNVPTIKKHANTFAKNVVVDLYQKNA